MKETKARGPPYEHDGHPYELAKTEAACIDPDRVCTRWGLRAEKDTDRCPNS